MLEMAVRRWFKAGLSPVEAGSFLDAHGSRSEQKPARLRTMAGLFLSAASFSLFHEAFFDELALASLALAVLSARQRQIGLFAGIPLSLDRAPLDRAAHPHEIAAATAVIDRSGQADAQLVRLGDKRILWAEDGEAFLMYARQGGKLVALFDPVGPRESWPGLVRAFRQMARKRNCIPVFYQASEALLSIDGMRGMRAVKLGELAEIDLATFDMKGGEWANLRRAINRATRDGLTYEFVSPEGIPGIMAEIRAISDAWLAHGGTREKRFSLGAFDPAYVASFPVAVARMDGHIVAFATLPTAEQSRSVFVDLMRFLPGAHRGVMDFLIVRLIEDLKARGHARLNLGMAPLAGLKRASLWDRFGRFVAAHGNRFYGFKGLYNFKAKFDPQWTPRYLIVPAGTSPYLAATATAMLIAGGFSGVFRR